MTSDAERTAIDRLTQRLSARFPLLEAAVVVRRAHHRFDDHPTRDVVPILVEDTARDALRVMPTDGVRDRRRRATGARDPPGCGPRSVGDRNTPRT